MPNTVKITSPYVDIAHLNHLFEKLELEIADLRDDMKQVKEKMDKEKIRIDLI